VESRGFFFGMIAQERRFRARQKTQQAALRHHFSFLSWNTGQILEIHTDAIRKGDRYLFMMMSRWRNTAQAVCELVEVGGEIVQLNFLIISFSTEEKLRI
jgi:hypothetical protein